MVINGKKLRIALRSADLTQEAAAKKLGISRQTLSIYIKSGELNADFLQNVRLKLGIDLTKSEEVTKNLQSEIVTNILQEPFTEYNVKMVKGIQVPVYDIEFAPGVMSTLLEKGDSHYPVGYLSIPQVSGCDAIITAKDDSMAPRINSGDWIGVKRIDNWEEWLPMNYIYSIVTDNIELIKYIRKSNEPDHFTIGTPNKEYPDDEIPKKVIREIWSVKTILPFSKIETLI